MLKLYAPLICSILLVSTASAQELILAQKARDVPTSKAAVVESEVVIDLALLRHPSSELALSLPDGNHYQAVLSGFEQRPDGGTTWRGQVPWRGLELPASVTLTVYDGLVVGTISTPDGIYELRPRPDRSHLLAKVDRSHESDCGGAVDPELATGSAPAGSPAGLPALSTTEVPEKATTIDVLAIYSSGARNLLGGHSQIRALIQHAADYANSSFSNSSTSPRVVLRHVTELAIAQNRWQNLDYLRNHSPIKNLRDEVGADLVAAFVHDVDDACGKGYLMKPVSTAFAPWAYSFSLVECSIRVFAHEIGHNMGLHHDPANAGSTPAFPWAYGHYVDQRFRTVMSYAAPCTNNQCPTIPQYSHPGISYQGLPTGIANQRHNARVLGATASVAAAFRPTRASFEAAFTYAPSEPAVDAQVSFTDRTTGSPSSWEWSFGDGTSSTARNPTHVYTEPGTYTVRLTARGGGVADTATQEIEVEDVVASFDVSPASPRAGLSTQFVDTSTGAPDSWSWSFGDGTSSTAADPMHVYASAGTYEVELTVARGGRSHTLITPIEVRDRFCTAADSRLCLDQDRFEVEVEWIDFESQTGTGTVAPQGSADSGIFWFFDAGNLEMLIKVLDGCGINDHFWVFAAATTDVGYTLRVTDTYTGEEREYVNPLGVSAPSITETQAFATCSASRPEASRSGAASEAPRAPAVAPAPAVDRVQLPAKANCQADATHLCLNGGRFRVEVDWRDFAGEIGPGTTAFSLDDSGMFWFFDSGNWEMLIKVLDGCDINGRYWVFAAATTNVEYTLRVTDTDTGAVREYDNSLGVASPAITDTQAFGSCSP